ncbi:MAG: hypothetical protein ACLUVD_08550 [Mediterraneibacter faecis]
MGVDLLTLKTLLGHSQIQTTFAYVSPGDDFYGKTDSDGSKQMAKAIRVIRRGTGGMLNGVGMET